MLIKIFTKIETYGTIFEFIWVNVYMIKQGYHHIDIYKPYQKFPGFSWEVWGKTCYFVFSVLPFELTSAQFVFTKFMRCLVKHWRINAIRIACFLDDVFGVASSYKMTLFHSKS